MRPLNMDRSKAQMDPDGAMDKKASGKKEGGVVSQASNTQNAALLDMLQLHLDQLLEAIAASREALEHKLEMVVVDIGLLRADQRKTAEKVQKNYRTLNELKPEM